MDDPKTPHDRLHHRLFSHPEVIEDLLRQVIRRLRPIGGPWIDELDWSTLKIENGVATSGNLDRRISDIVWSIAWRGSPLYLILLIEFQSQPDRFMALRQLTYLSLFYESLVKAKRLDPEGRLPPALPVCLYNGDQPWRAPDRLESLIAPPPEELRDYQIRFRHLLVDELDIEIDLTAEERNSAGGVFALQQAETVEELDEVLGAIERWLPAAEFQTLRVDLVNLMRRVLPPELENSRTRLQEFAMYPKERLAEDFYRKQAKAEAMGHAKGRAEGQEEGRAEGQRRLLGNLLRLKFGEVPADVNQQLEAADCGQLEAWAARVLTASTLQAVFAPQP